MIPLDQARERVLDACRRGPTVTVALDDALGAVLAEDVTAADDVPPFANSAMDGYAVRAADTAGASAGSPVRLRVSGTIAAGADVLHPVEVGHAVRIMTGAPFPPGADAVAIVETTTVDADDVLVAEPARPGEHVRAAGEDLAAGSTVFAVGTQLGPGHLGVLASAGRADVAVVAPPTVGVLSTGDELVEGGGPLRPGQIRDSNRRTLLALVRRDGWRAVDLGIARDDEDDIRARLVGAAATCDAVLTSGGVSMGAFDLVRKILEDMAEMAWMQVAIRPAKPFAFGTLDGVPVFGLPGNPVSSMVSYELLARPGLRRMAGHPDGRLVQATVPAIVDDTSLLRRPDGRVNYIRVAATVGADGRYHVRSTGGQGSNLLWPMAVADALAVVPSGDGVPAGGETDILLLDR
jgi:molybdenum cofactor synthesis domain-containing protein